MRFCNTSLCSVDSFWTNASSSARRFDQPPNISDEIGMLVKREAEEIDLTIEYRIEEKDDVWKIVE